MRLLLATLVLTVVAFAGSVGTFGGRVITVSVERSDHWIYIKGSNGLGRRVEISGARITYSDDVPVRARATSPADDLRPGALVEVTAEQDARGEWVAQSIQILRLPAKSTQRSRLAPLLPAKCL